MLGSDLPPSFLLPLLQVMHERGLWDEALKTECPLVHDQTRQKLSTKHAREGDELYNKCCLRKVLEAQPDFLAQKCWMEEVVVGAGHKVIFLPKFHPELNFIERYWGRIKKWLRWRCDDAWHSLVKNVDKVLNSNVACDVILMRRYSRICWRYIDAYHKGMSAELAYYAVKLSKSHRMVSEKLDGIMFKEWLAKHEGGGRPAGEGEVWDFTQDEDGLQDDNIGLQGHEVVEEEGEDGMDVVDMTEPEG